MEKNKNFLSKIVILLHFLIQEFCIAHDNVSFDPFPFRPSGLTKCTSDKDCQVSKLCSVELVDIECICALVTITSKINDD